MLTDILSPTSTLAFNRGDTGTVEDIQGNTNMSYLPEVTGGGGSNIFILSD